MIVFAATALTGGCTSPNLGTTVAARAPALTEPTACTEPGTLSNRLVIDWSPLDRAKLESAARKGLVLVNVTGCAAHIVDTCVSPRRYEYAPTSKQHELLLLRDRAEVAAHMPFGLARFDSTLGRTSALRVAMTVVGRYESPPQPVAERDLEGDCDGATHAVTSISVGSFEIAAESATRVAVGADAWVGSGRVGTDAERRTLDSAGVEARCAEPEPARGAPPTDCGVPLRIELRRIGANAPSPAAMTGNAPAETDGGSLRASARARAEVLPCYRRALAADPHVHGTLTLMASLDRVGDVVGVSAKHDVPDALAECAVRRVSGLRFSRADQDEQRVLVLPFVFRGAPER